MTVGEFLIVVVAFPFVVALGAWLGRKAQRAVWLLDRPYEERVRGLKRGSA